MCGYDPWCEEVGLLGFPQTEIKKTIPALQIGDRFLDKPTGTYHKIVSISSDWVDLESAGGVTSVDKEELLAGGSWGLRLRFRDYNIEEIKNA